MSSRDRAPRYRVPLRVIYDADEAGFWTAQVADMCETGLFVKTTHSLTPGTVVTIVPEEESDDDLPFELRAEVVRAQAYDLERHWDREPGLAFKLLDVEREDLEKLRVYLAAKGRPVT